MEPLLGAGAPDEDHSWELHRDRLWGKLWGGCLENGINSQSSEPQPKSAKGPPLLENSTWQQSAEESGVTLWEQRVGGSNPSAPTIPKKLGEDGDGYLRA